MSCLYSHRNETVQNRITMFCLLFLHSYLWEIYIFPGSVCLFCYRKICGQILEIYKSLADKWIWKLGLWPPNSQKRNTYVGFSLKCKKARGVTNLQYGRGEGKDMVLEIIIRVLCTFGCVISEPIWATHEKKPEKGGALKWHTAAANSQVSLRSRNLLMSSQRVLNDL
jgi:hypothetical protein